MTSLTIDELEILTPDELGKFLLDEVRKDPMDVQFIQDLITCGCHIDIRDEFGFTALHIAAYCGDIELVQFLISSGAPVDAKNKADRTALHWAAQMGHLEVAKFLISKRAQVDVRDINGETPWDIASDRIQADVLELKPK